MLHRPRNIMRMIAYSGIFLAAGLAPALAMDPTGDWRVADGVANIRVAQCNGSMWGAVAWEQTPGGRDDHNPDVSKQNRPTLGMPILIDMKKKPGVDAWEGQVYNAKDGQYYSSTIKPVDPDHLEIQGLRTGLSLRRGNLDPRRRPNSVKPRQQHGQGRAEGHRRATQGRCADDNGGRAEDHRVRQPGTKSIRSKTGRGGAAGRSGRRYLPTPRYRGVCPLAPAGTTAPRQAS